MEVLWTTSLLWDVLQVMGISAMWAPMSAEALEKGAKRSPRSMTLSRDSCHDRSICCGFAGHSCCLG